jgi:hypothetical protein
MNKLKKTALAAALVSAMGVSGTASADIITMTFDGLFTMLNPDGSIVANGDSTLAYGLRTAVTGTASFDTATGAGTGDFTPFSFFGNGNASATGISFQAIGDGDGGAGPLVLTNMGFTWNNNNGIPVSIVMDASGFFAAVGAGLAVSDTLSGSGAVPASNNASFFGVNIPIGPSPFVTTTWDTTTIPGSSMGSNPSGTLPLIADTDVNVNVTGADEIGMGGSPMIAGPFAGNNANFDFTSIHITTCEDTGTPGGCAGTAPIPVPAAVWLFGSGLMGLVGVARRRKQS